MSNNDLGKRCDYCGEPANGLKPEAMSGTGAGAIVTYEGGDFHADCLAEMTVGDSDGYGEEVAT